MNKINIAIFLTSISVAFMVSPLVFHFKDKSVLDLHLDKEFQREKAVVSRCAKFLKGDVKDYLACIGLHLDSEEVFEYVKFNYENEKELNEIIEVTTGKSVNELFNYSLLGNDNSEIKKFDKLLFGRNNKECSQLGVSKDSNDCRVYEKLFENLKESSFFFNKPNKMTVGEIAEIDLSLNPSNYDLAKKQLDGLEGIVIKGSSKISRHMSAELFGPTFKTSPSQPQKRTIIDSNTSIWKWKIEPLKEGIGEPLTLDVFVHLEVDGKTSPPIIIRTFRERIIVEVKTSDAIKKFAVEWSPIILLIFAIIVAIWSFRPGTLARKISKYRLLMTSWILKIQHIGFDYICTEAYLT